ncbi:12493_t:CDS:2 [Acaulospora colombiana]|uniref:12493_t:CDS:1 n=1 Tax=Acaulospora colombiana TaxID=27376 RepID=A0ACA9K5X0_9GLOM|nr:12493_t:CDS:2 [Acaulospora colombiana]
MASQEDIYHDFQRAAKQSYAGEYPHLEDLWSISAKGHLVDGELYMIEDEKCHLQHLSFIVRTAIDAVLTLLTDWTLFFKHPLHWWYLVFVYPVVLYALFVAEVASLIVDTLKLKFIKTAVHKRWTKYVAPEILFDAEFFHAEENRSIVDEGIGALEKPYHPDVEDGEEPVKPVHHFNLDIAQFLLFISDVVYNRASDKVLEAKHKIDMIKHHPEQRDGLLREAVEFLQESDEPIRTQVKKWPMKYKSVSELNTLGESYAGIFFSERHNFIVVAFKGQTADKFDSFVKDLMFQHVDGRPIVGFKSYTGYRSLLCPETEKPGPSYIAIIEAIQNTARLIRNSNPKRTHINVWITGHSMGGALATLFYGRCLKSPTDLGEHCVLRDAYTFGSPSVADSEIASTYVSSLNKRGDLVNTLWRVVDDKDVMTRCPPGFYHAGGVGRYNILDNTHVGEAIRFYQDGAKKPKLMKTSHVSGENPIPVIRSSRPKENAKIEIPIHSFDKKLPPYIRDHMTYRYFMALTLARNHLNDHVEVIYQFIDTANEIIVDGIGWHFIGVAIFNVIWLVLVVNEELVLAWITILIVASQLSYIYYNLKVNYPPQNSFDAIFIHLPFNLYHAWIMVILTISTFVAFIPDKENGRDPGILEQVLGVLALCFLEVTSVGYIEKFKGDLIGAGVITITLYGISFQQDDNAIIHWVALVFAVISSIHLLKTYLAKLYYERREESAPLLV